MLPHDFKEFMAVVGDKRNKTFIVKPEASSQGKGIFLTRNPDSLINSEQQGGQPIEHMVV
jgi:glutathione synthase/RimK-type ligase-like ATP-grasp enzyme